MLFVYGALMPLRVLEEIRFWKRQEREHTIVIRQLVPALEPAFAQLLAEWESALGRVEQSAEQWIAAIIRRPAAMPANAMRQIELLASVAIAQSGRFVDHVEEMMRQSAAVQAIPAAPVVLRHIIRESEYFLGVMRALHPSATPFAAPSHTPAPYVSPAPVPYGSQAPASVPYASSAAVPYASPAPVPYASAAAVPYVSPSASPYASWALARYTPGAAGSAADFASAGPHAPPDAPLNPVFSGESPISSTEADLQKAYLHIAPPHRPGIEGGREPSLAASYRGDTGDVRAPSLVAPYRAETEDVRDPSLVAPYRADTEDIREPALLRPDAETGREPALTAAGEGTWSMTPGDGGRPVPIGGHVLPPLPYPYDALEPHIDAETMREHHDKHHKSYVDGLNKAETEMAEARRTGEFSLIKHWEREAAFNGAGHYLHTIFWSIMNPKGGGKPSGPIAGQIARDFGGFPAFQMHFSAAAERVEGSGWALLVWSPRSRRLEILQAEKHQNLSQWDVVPLLVLDVWEHAYYLRYKSARRRYIDAWWNVVFWPAVNERFEAARRLKWTPV